MTDEQKEKLSQSYEIRLLTEKDIPAVASVYVEAFNKADIGEEWIQETAENFMRWWFEREPNLFFVATHKGQIVGGVVAGIKPWWDGPHLADGELFVHPDFQKQGIGTKLLKTLLEEADRKYGEIVEFEGIASKEADFPMSWYKKLGIKKTGLVHIGAKPKEILEKLK